MIDKDDIRPRGTVQVKCSKCDWEYWVSCTDPILPNGPFVCYECSGLYGKEKVINGTPDQKQ
jgi:hypothetical protein